MEYKDPGRYVPLYTYCILGVPGLGFPVESLYIKPPMSKAHPLPRGGCLPPGGAVTQQRALTCPWRVRA